MCVFLERPSTVLVSSEITGVPKYTASSMPASVPVHFSIYGPLTRKVCSAVHTCCNNTDVHVELILGVKQLIYKL